MKLIGKVDARIHARKRTALVGIAVASAAYGLFLLWYCLDGSRTTEPRILEHEIQDTLYSLMFEDSRPGSEEFSGLSQAVDALESPPWEWVLLQLWLGNRPEDFSGLHVETDVSALGYLGKYPGGNRNYWQTVSLDTFESPLLGVYTWHSHAQESRKNPDLTELVHYKQAGILAHNNEWLRPGEELLEMVVEHTGDPEARAWLASIETQKALQVDSVLRKVHYVESGMQQLDELCQQYPRNIAVRMTRILNYVSLPTLFDSADSAISDLIAVMSDVTANWNYVETNESFEQVQAEIPVHSIERAVELVRNRDDVSAKDKAEVYRTWLELAHD